MFKRPGHPMSCTVEKFRSQRDHEPNDVKQTSLHECSWISHDQSQQSFGVDDPYQPQLPQQLPQKRPFPSHEAEGMFILVPNEDGTISRPRSHWGRTATRIARSQTPHNLTPKNLTLRKKTRRSWGMTGMELKAVDREMPPRKIAEIISRSLLLGGHQQGSRIMEQLAISRAPKDMEANKVFQDSQLKHRVLKSRACY